MKFEKEFKLFLDTWGESAQIMMCIEEMSELTKALCKHIRYSQNEIENTKNMENLKEEIADVLNTVEQMRWLFGFEEIEQIRQHKVDRCMKKLENL